MQTYSQVNDKNNRFASEIGLCASQMRKHTWIIMYFTGFKECNPQVYEKSPPVPPHVLMNFRGFPPGCGDSVADFWGWDAHEVRLRCPDDVCGDMQEDEIPGGALSLYLLTTQTMVTTGIFPCKEKFPW